MGAVGIAEMRLQSSPSPTLPRWGREPEIRLPPWGREQFFPLAVKQAGF